MKLFLAQGFGVGRIPIAPGTFGSLIGLLWFVLLLLTGSFWLFLIGAIAGIGCSVWLCGKAERILQRTDPPSIVLDEIAALPLCFVACLIGWMSEHGHFPAPGDFFSYKTWWLTPGIFALFRFFDVLKPWPIRQSQVLAGGWGVTADDVLAAAYVNLVVMTVWALRAAW